MDTKQIADIILSNNKKKVIVIGDTIIDSYIKAPMVKISPEAPVPALYGKLEKWSNKGGAANVAEGLARLGADVHFVTLNGTHELLSTANFKVYDIFPNRTPPVKTRVVCHQHHICRIDDEKTYNMDMVYSRKLLGDLEHLIHDVNPAAIVISDYKKSGLHGELVDTILDITRTLYHMCLVVVDSKATYKVSSDSLEVVMTPNIYEWESYQQKHGLTASTVITLGDAGLSYIANRESLPHYIRPFASPSVVDVCGAGDSITATVALLLSPFEDTEDRITKLNVAQLVAETSIQKFGVNPPFLEEVLEYAQHALKQT